MESLPNDCVKGTYHNDAYTDGHPSDNDEVVGKVGKQPVVTRLWRGEKK